MSLAMVVVPALPGGPILPDGMQPCGKDWLRSRAEGNAVLARMVSDRDAKVWVLKVYYCHDCDGFHVGHTRRRQ
jgi:hypothetical protein